MATGLDSLSPAKRAQYEAMLPELTKSARNAANARGMFYSGAATDAETKAKTDLLAKLASESAATEAQQAEADRNRAFEERLRGEDRKAGREASNKALIAQGVGSGLGLLGAYWGRDKNSGQNLVNLGNGKFGMFNPKDNTINPINVGVRGQVGGGAPEVGGAALSPSIAEGGPGGGLDAISDSTPGAPATLFSGWNKALPQEGAGATPSPSMWQQVGAGAKAGGLSGVGAAGGGAYAGSQLGNAIAGRGGRNNDIGAALGGLLGAGAGAYGGGQPWKMGLGGLAGSALGGLLGNLFR